MVQEMRMSCVEGTPGEHTVGEKGKICVMKYKAKNAKMNGHHPKLGRGKAWVSPEPQKDHDPARP